MAWDEDGTIGLYAWDVSTFPAVGGNPTGAWSEMTSANRIQLNSEQPSVDTLNRGAANFPVTWVCLLFPELRDIYGVYVQLDVYAGDTARDSDSWLAHSADTTTGLDGSWAETETGVFFYESGSIADYRENHTTVTPTVTGVRGLKMQLGTNTIASNTAPTNIHVYGQLASGETPDRILILDDPASTAFSVSHDWGDTPRGTVHDEVLKLKNNSGSFGANNIVLTFEDSYRGSSAWYTIKEAGGSFASSLSITGPLAAGATYANAITVRKTVPSNEALGPHAARLQVAVGSWA